MTKELALFIGQDKHLRAIARPFEVPRHPGLSPATFSGGCQ